MGEPHRTHPPPNGVKKYTATNAATHPTATSASIRRCISGPYGLALGPDSYTGVVETTEHGGYPLLDHLHQILGGPVVWAPAVAIATGSVSRPARTSAGGAATTSAAVKTIGSFGSLGMDPPPPHPTPFIYHKGG